MIPGMRGPGSIEFNVGNIEAIRIVGHRLIEVTARQQGDPESGSGGAELELEFEGGATLLVYVHQDGTLIGEID